ncbi:kif11-a [Symbiodinium natans]|uniref:Kif11-a protein n=1 Tax=Symbiodinium natans TaxID=878477 RepID=A0A812IDZ0_9DINO|nr:kif11-a [Symbiodinium natans]
MGEHVVQPEQWAEMLWAIRPLDEWPSFERITPRILQHVLPHLQELPPGTLLTTLKSLATKPFKEVLASEAPSAYGPLVRAPRSFSRAAAKAVQEGKWDLRQVVEAFSALGTLGFYEEASVAQLLRFILDAPFLEPHTPLLVPLVQACAELHVHHAPLLQKEMALDESAKAATRRVAEETEVDVPAVQVCVRVRPLLDEELRAGASAAALRAARGSVTLSLSEGNEENIADRDCRRVRKPQEFSFSSVFGPESSQEDVYDGLKLDALMRKVAAGYHATVFAYGQTGSGKTYTMEGYRYRPDAKAADAGKPQACVHTTTPERLGVIPRVLHRLFAYVEKLQQEEAEETFSVSISFLQIYQERIFDLLNPAPVVPTGFGQTEDSGLRLRWDASREHFYVENLFVYQCTSAEDALKFYNAGVQRKHMASTAMNIASSRSHTVLMLTLLRRSALAETSELGAGEAVREVTSNLTLVDLAGSEKAAAANEGNPERFKEAVNINQSLFVLRRVITALSRREGGQEEDPHIPYRESKLTSLLQHAIGGKGSISS